MTDSHDTSGPAASPPQPSAELWIAEVHVSNFRNIVDVRIPLEPGATFLVGENNVGKSSFLLAIATACGFRTGTRDDLHRTGQATAREAIIDLVIRSTDAEFTDVVAQRLSGIYGSGPGPGQWTAIRTRLIESRESSLLTARAALLDMGRRYARLDRDDAPTNLAGA